MYDLHNTSFNKRPLEMLVKTSAYVVVTKLELKTTKTFRFHSRHLTVNSRFLYFNEKSTDVLIYDYRKLNVMKRLNCLIAIVHHNITMAQYHNIDIDIVILISRYHNINIVILWYCDNVILWYCDIVMQYCYLTI